MAVDLERKLRVGGRMGQDRRSVAVPQIFGRVRVIGMRMRQQDRLDMPSQLDEVIDLRQTLSPIYDILNFFKWLSLGAAAVLIFAAVLQVSNTVRLAAMARRREIGIMRLVGASSLYIQLPFVLEIVLAALVGAALACGTLAVVIWQFVPKAQSIVIRNV